MQYTALNLVCDYIINTMKSLAHVSKAWCIDITHTSLRRQVLNLLDITCLVHAVVNIVIVLELVLLVCLACHFL